MRILILTQNETLYLPTAFSVVCRELAGEIVCIVSAPAMSTHGGAVRGFVRHFRLFGVRGTAIMAFRVIAGHVRNRLSRRDPRGPFFSIQAVAESFTIPFYSVKKVSSPEFHEIVEKYKPDLLISMSCPQIIGKKVRERFSAGCINVHGAPLPRYRGLMPAFWALKNGESMTAVTVHDLAEKLDNGEILVQKEVAIAPDETWDSLVRKTKAVGAEALVDAVRRIKDGTIQRRPNRDEDATYFSFPTVSDREEFVAAGRRFF